ncbi:polymorphic toxin-type HINT domain-containing protein [Streptomyces sp. HJ7]
MQEAAARALGGTDDDVLDYLRTGWKKAEQDETREQVRQLSTQSPFARVRTGAADALKGTDAQIRDFYTTGQYKVGADDYSVRVSQINHDGGPGVKEASKAALADGSGKALVAFLNSGQYVARNSDESVIASQLVNDRGPEVKAAAKIALAGPADQLHNFVQVGQYMADRKDKLADTHIARVQVLLAQTARVAAKAQQNKWIAAEAAAKAKKASTEADQAATEAKNNAKLAEQYKADADKAATSAEKSAAEAAKSATTARNAADTADRDAAAAEESAAQAEFSANYARNSAEFANDAADEARESAHAAGKSAKEADTLAKQAWEGVRKKREAEEAEARRKAEEARKQQEKQKAKKQCYFNPFSDRGDVACISGGLANGGVDLIMVEIAPRVTAIALAVTGVDEVIDACVEDPSAGKCLLAITMNILPTGRFKAAKKGLDTVEEISKGTRIGKLKKCFKCFLAGTQVLMGDNSTKNIESVKVGDSVIATDPFSGETGRRTVTDLIVTEHDKDFDDLTIVTPSGDQHLTATNEHPFWSPSQKAWVEAAYLRPGMTLRTVDGSTVSIKNNRPFTNNARTYNLTVAGMHTYYVLAGKKPVLVHNSGDCGGPGLSIIEGQFGKKWGKHAQDYGLNPGDTSARVWFRDKIADVRASYNEVRRGAWNPASGGGDDYFFYRKGKDLLVTKGGGTFVTMFPMDKPNGWFEKATPYS